MPLPEDALMKLCPRPPLLFVFGGTLLSISLFASPLQAGNEILVAQSAGLGNVVTMPWPLVGPQITYAPTFQQPNSVRVGPDRCIYLADYLGGTVRRLF